MTRKKHSAFHVVEDYQGTFFDQAYTGHGVHGYCPGSSSSRSGAAR